VLLGDSATAEIRTTLDELSETATSVSDGTVQRNQILQQINPLRALLLRANDGAANQWFILGQSIQSISVAAQLQLQADIAEPFE